MQWLEGCQTYPPSPPPSTPTQHDVKRRLRYILGARSRVPASTQSEPSPVLSSVWARPAPRLIDLSQDLVWASAPASPVYSLRQALHEDSEPDSEEGVRFLTERANVRDFAVNGNKGLGATFPLIIRRRRAESFSDLITPEKSAHIGDLSKSVLAHSREQQWRDQWGHRPGQSVQYYASFFWDREPAYTRSEREMWEVRERYEQEEKILQRHRLKQIREQIQLGPWHGMTREEKKRGKNKAKRARQRERERARREAERVASGFKSREQEEEGQEKETKEEEAEEEKRNEEEEQEKEEGKEAEEEKEEIEEAEKKDANQPEGKEDAKQQHEEATKQEENQSDAEQDAEEPNYAEQDPTASATTTAPNLPPSPPPTPWPPHSCDCFSFLQCAAHRDIPDSCHLCASFYFAGYWCGMEKRWCNFGPFVEESQVLGRRLKLMRAREGEDEWGIVEWDEGAEEGRGAWV